VSKAKPVIAILVPVFNEEVVVPLFFKRIEPVLAQLATEFTPHLVFLNNASTDRTVESIMEIRQNRSDVFLLSLAKNVGYQRSIEFGLRSCHGDVFVFVDVDCEDPPEMILQFVKEYKAGHDIVYGERVDRIEVLPIKLMRKAFYRLMRALADDDIIVDMAEFSLMTNEVREAIVQDSSSFPFIRASIGRVGFSRKGIPYRRDKRIAGETHYNFLGMVFFAVAGILASGTWLLRVVTYCLPVFLLAMLTLGVFAAQGAPWAFPWLVVLGFGYCGTALSFLSIYLARAYKNSLGRPNAFLDQRRSYPQQDAAQHDRTRNVVRHEESVSRSHLQ
jgi:glycosyltransferase involved in cell wall biosynthesis